jgi:hypothetical protein
MDRLMLRGGARTQVIIRSLRHDPDVDQTLARYLDAGEIEDRFQAADLAGVLGTRAIVDHLRPLLDFHDARYYPSDALIRHAAMASLVRQALAMTKAPSQAPPPSSSAPPSTPNAENRP